MAPKPNQPRRPGRSKAKKGDSAVALPSDPPARRSALKPAFFEEQQQIGEVMLICGRAQQLFRDLRQNDFGIDGEIEFCGADLRPTGSKIYLQLKSGGSHLRWRKGDQREVFEVGNSWHLEYWTRQPVDVYLIVRRPGAGSRWMNVSAYLRQRPAAEASKRQIVFSGEIFDAEALLRLRDRILGISARP